MPLESRCWERLGGLGTRFKDYKNRDAGFIQHPISLYRLTLQHKFGGGLEWRRRDLKNRSQTP